MDNRIFDLMEKMYNEMLNRFDQVDKRFDQVDKRFDQVDKRFEKVEGELVRLENKMDTNFKALYDGYKQNTEKLNVIESQLKDLSGRLEKQEVEIRVIKGGK